jgi:hypothetical protein
MCRACAAEVRSGRLCTECARVVLERSMLPHVPRLAVSVLALGALYGVALGAYLVVLVAVLADSGLGGELAGDEALGLGVIVALALSTLPAFALHLAAGLMLRRRRGRLLSYAAIGSGFVAVGGACFFPLSVAVLIYAALVLGDVDVRAAFDAEQPRAEG